MVERIALIHAVTAAIAPVHDAFQRHWPEADYFDLLDTSLSPDRERDGELTVEMRRRILTLAKYAEGTGAAAILFTCSAFGEAIAAAADDTRLPVLKPNAAMFEAGIAIGNRIGMLATFAPSVASMEAEFRDIVDALGSPATLESHCVEGAMTALKQGDGAEHDRLIAAAAARFAGFDVVLLAHFSTSRAEEAVRAQVSCPVLTAPGAAVARLKSRLHAD